MGSSDNETGVVDCSVGSIVWVRRRNGSWWPGKILGMEELSAAHLMSPRSGTPVKLLGREDASVDWYNLEKSKRVKAFRCGEFDDCILRAESAQGMPPKKREKYARREDAILHALELEKQLVESKFGQSSYPNCKISKSSEAAKEIVTPSTQLGKHDDKHIHPIPHLEESDSTIKEMKTDHRLHTEEVGEESQLEGNDNNSEVVPRIRDLQDLGTGIPAAKQKLSSSIASNGSCMPLHDENTRPLPSDTLITGNIMQTYSKGYLGRKRKSRAVFSDESLVRKHDKRRPLVQVLQNSPELPVQQSLLTEEEHKGIASHAERRSSICLPGESSNCLDDKPSILNSMASSPFHFEVSNHRSAALIEKNTSGSSESTESDPSGTDSLNSGADGDMLEHPDATFEPRSLESFGAQEQHRSMSFKLERDDLSLANDAPRLFPQDLAGIGMSQWKNKGKRNIRRLGKKPTDVTERRPSGGSLYGSHSHLDVRDNSGFVDHGLSEKNFGIQGCTDDHRGNLLISKSNGLDAIVHSTNEWEYSAWNDQQPALRGYCEDLSNYLDCALVVGRHGSMLVDVDLKVQSSYQREHVPMISLRSKLNGKAIVGHPIQVEAIEDGSSEILLAGLYPEPLNNDDTALLSMWKTARRTANFRVPRSHPSAKSEIQQTAQGLQNLVSSGHKASTMRNSSYASSGLRTNKKFPRKPLKKISLSSVQKTKFLSSIGVEQKVGQHNLVNGLIKGDSGPTAVACIPVKLVFSRFFEELFGRHQ